MALNCANPGVTFVPSNMYNQNGGYIPQNFNPNQQISTPVFHQNTVPAQFTSAPQLNPQHVFVNRFPPPHQPPPSQFVPNFNVIRSTPPPSLMPPRVQQNMNNTPHPNMSAQFSPQQLPNQFSSPQLPSQFSSPQLPTQFSAPPMFNRSFSNPRSGFFNGQEQSQSQNAPTAFPQESAAHIRPPTFQIQSPVNMPATFNQQAQNSNFQYGNNVNMRHNPFSSQPTNSQNRTTERHHNYNYKNHNRNNEYRNKWNNDRKNLPKNFDRFPVIKREKEDKLSKAFACDPCDRAYQTELELREHLSEHIKCNSGNCQFEAHPKIVFLHKKMQHVAGYAEKINKLSSNEEIEKWRAERRKRFPTQENIAKRQAEQAEKEARGEVVEIPESGKMKRKRDFQRNRYQNSKRRRRQNQFGNHNSLNFAPKDKDPVSESEDSDGEPLTKLAKFAGVNADYSSETVMALISPSSKAGDGVQKTEDKNVQAEVESGKDSSKEIPATPERPKEIIEEIVINSSTAEESGSDSVKEVPVTKCSPVEVQVLVQNTTPTLVVYDESDDEAPTEVSTKVVPSCLGTVEDSHNSSPVETTVNKNNPPKERKDRGPKKDGDKPRREREFIPRKKDEPKRCSVSLLKALYADEIKKERNKMFQCLRYIVQNEFFGIGTD